MSIVAFESFRTLPVQIGVMGNMVVTVTRDGQIQLGELKAEDIATLRSLSPAWFFVAQALLQYCAAFGPQIQDCPPGELPAEALAEMLVKHCQDRSVETLCNRGEKVD